MSIDQSKNTQLFENWHTRLYRGGVSRTIRRWFELQALRLQIKRERRQLATLPPHLLDDMGINEASAEQESRLPFTDVPPQRLAMQKHSQFWLINLD